MPGAWRTVQNFVVNNLTGVTVYTPPPAADVPVLMRELVEWLRHQNTESEIHPVLVAGIAQFQSVHIHPFIDGNGRTSRLLSTLCLYQAGYDFKRLFTISEYYDRDRTKFYAALQSVREAHMDLTGWLDFFVTGLSTQLHNARQAILVAAFLEHARLSLAECEKLLPEVARRTVQRDLKRLIEAGLVGEVSHGDNRSNAALSLVAGQAVTSCDNELCQAVTTSYRPRRLLLHLSQAGCKRLIDPGIGS